MVSIYLFHFANEQFFFCRVVLIVLFRGVVLGISHAEFD